jgi:two-component system, OmpR family, response regulator
MHALILDDEAAIGRVICRVAQGAGFTAHSTTDVPGFQTQFSETAPDVVFLDLQLGAEDGLGQLRFLADQHYPRAVILMSGYDQRVLAAAERLGRDLGLDILASINKPFRADDLSSLFSKLPPHLAAAGKAST